ncbi:protein sidekick-1-like [Osmerus eperlanus]|uniref:protein sidekick-1-like n=1 Tax=Osmerus eperlanus TaxID=29151 RepID=UPI002E145683
MECQCVLGGSSLPQWLLEGYRVVYQPSAPVHGVTRQVTVDVKGSWQRWLQVRELSRGVAYSFSIQARTVNYGPPLLANLTSQPLNGTPGSPLEMSITRTSSALTIHWLEGNAGGGTYHRLCH